MPYLVTHIIYSQVAEHASANLPPFEAIFEQGCFVRTHEFLGALLLNYFLCEVLGKEHVQDILEKRGFNLKSNPGFNH